MSACVVWVCSAASALCSAASGAIEQVKQIWSIAASGRPNTHLGWLWRHAPRAKRRRRDRGQSYRYFGRAAHRFATHQRLDIPVHLFGTEFWATRQRLDIPVHLFGTEFWAASLNGRLRTGRQRGSGRAGSKRVKWRTNEYHARILPPHFGAGGPLGVLGGAGVSRISVEKAVPTAYERKLGRTLCYKEKKRTRTSGSPDMRWTTQQSARRAPTARAGEAEAEAPSKSPNSRHGRSARHLLVLLQVTEVRKDRVEARGLILSRILCLAGMQRLRASWVAASEHRN